MLPQIDQELELSAGQAGWLSTVLLLGFAVAGPPIGYLADRLRRPRLLAVGFALESLATVVSGLARTYDQLQVARVLVGVGAATFVVIALTWLMDLFPEPVRGRVLAGFFLAMPLGAASGWAWAPGLRQLADGVPGGRHAGAVAGPPGPRHARSACAAGARASTSPACGSTSKWARVARIISTSWSIRRTRIRCSAWRSRRSRSRDWSTGPHVPDAGQGTDAAQVDRLLGGTLLAAAILGIGAGGWLADAFAIRRPRLVFILPGLAMLGAIACVLMAIYGRGVPWVFGGIFLAVGLMFLEFGPCYTIISRVVMPNMRAVACAVTLSAAHLLGDLWSPTLMGWVIDTFGQADSMATGFGQVLAALGAVPVAQPGREPQNLTAGMLVVLPALLIAGIVLLAGSRHLPREMALMLAKLRAAPEPSSRQAAGSVTCEIASSERSHQDRVWRSGEVDRPHERSQGSPGTWFPAAHSCDPDTIPLNSERGTRDCPKVLRTDSTGSLSGMGHRGSLKSGHEAVRTPRRQRRRSLGFVELESRCLLTATVTCLGQDGQDLVGPDASQGPDGIQDLHLQLANLSGTVASIAIQAPGGFSGRRNPTRPVRRWRSISRPRPPGRATFISTRRSRATCLRPAVRCRSGARRGA